MIKILVTNNIFTNNEDDDDKNSIIITENVEIELNRWLRKARLHYFKWIPLR